MKHALVSARREARTHPRSPCGARIARVCAPPLKRSAPETLSLVKKSPATTTFTSGTATTRESRHANAALHPAAGIEAVSGNLADRNVYLQNSFSSEVSALKRIQRPSQAQTFDQFKMLAISD